MARIIPFAEVVGEEVIAHRFSAEDLASMPSVSPEGTPLRHGQGVPLREILADATNGTYRMDLPRNDKNLLWKLDNLDETTKRHRDDGFIDVPIDHLIGRDPELGAHIGCIVEFDEAERQLLRSEGHV